MEMSQIRYVLTAAKTLNFTRAAALCNVTQPALTKGVKALEEEMGSPVFLREGRKVMLSEFGRTILPHLEQIAAQAEATKTLAQNFRLLEKAPLRLGVMSTIGHQRLARFLGRFEKTHHGVELELTEAPAPRLAELLEAGDIDLAVTNADRAGDLRAIDLYEERYVVIFPPQHRLGALNAVRLGDLDGEPYVDRLACELRETVMAVCADTGVSLYARFRSEREDWVQAMVLAEIGFAFMPEYAVSLPGLMQRPLIEPEVTRRVALVSMPGRPHTPAAAAFARAAQTFPWPG